LAIPDLRGAIIASFPLAVYVIDVHGVVQLWNRACEELFGWTAPEVLGKYLPIIAADGRADFELRCRRAFAGESLDAVTLSRLHHDGHPLQLTITTVPIRDDSGALRAVLSIAQTPDIPRRALTGSPIQVTFDTLTGLHNRQSFMAVLTKALGHSRCNETVVCLDLDRFKDLNDTYGHEVGDELLKVFARRLRRATRNDDVVARMGSDEFGILLRGVGPDTVAAALDRLFLGLRGPVVIEEREFGIEVTGGAALCRAGATRQQVLRAADIALSEAKRFERGGFLIFDQGMHETVIERMELEAQLARAVDRKELIVHYQPIFRLRDGTVSGAEALVRWQHPKLGLLAPARFIHLAEASGSILGIGRWVLRQSCQQLRTWQDNHPSCDALVMSVNL